ncbi:hypothetical protein A3768_5660 (plasmid) [Ralstonia solanacearum]|nr:hypothetical protein A3768_5660 [Ralstonia solanacearum]
MPIRRPHKKLTHAVRLVGWSLQDDGATADEFCLKRVGVRHCEVAKVTVVASC